MRVTRLVAMLLLVVGCLVGAAAYPTAAALTCFGKTVTRSGSGTITGTAGNDVIYGSAGPGTIHGLRRSEFNFRPSGGKKDSGGARQVPPWWGRGERDGG